MKKMILAGSVLIGIYSLSSCTKLYNCTCTTENTDTLTKEKLTNTTSFKQRETSKKLAEAKCQQNAFTYYDGDKHLNVTTCTLEQVKNK